VFAVKQCARPRVSRARAGISAASVPRFAARRRSLSHDAKRERAAWHHGGVKRATSKPTKTKSAATRAVRTTGSPTRRVTAKPAAAKRAVARPATAKPATARPATAKPATAKPATAKPATAKPATGKPAAAKPSRRPAATKPARRSDFGAPTAGFFARQPAKLRPILEQLRDLIQEAAPDARSSIKWGMPFYTIGEAMMCALGGHKAHVNLILPGPPGTYADPGALLSGGGKTGRHLKLTTVDELPRDAVRGWLKTAAQLARTSP
jgi:hypothetical protein